MFVWGVGTSNIFEDGFDWPSSSTAVVLAVGTIVIPAVDGFVNSQRFEQWNDKADIAWQKARDDAERKEIDNAAVFKKAGAVLKAKRALLKNRGLHEAADSQAAPLEADEAPGPTQAPSSSTVAAPISISEPPRSKRKMPRAAPKRLFVDGGGWRLSPRLGSRRAARPAPVDGILLITGISAENELARETETRSARCVNKAGYRGDPEKNAYLIIVRDMCDNDNNTDSGSAPVKAAGFPTSHGAQRSCCETGGGGGGGGGGGAVVPGPVVGENAVAEGVTLKSDRGDANGINREVEAVHKRLLAESLIVFHDKRTTSRQLATQLLVRLVGRLAVVQGADDIQTVVEKFHVPHASKSGVNVIITDLEPKFSFLLAVVPKLMEFLRSRSLRPGLGKLPIVSVIVVIDAGDPRPEMLASAFDSGVDAVLQRPLQKSVVTACVGEVLRRQANIEFVYKDVVGEVETFNYPRFVLEGFHFDGVGEGSVSAGDGDGVFNEAMGEAVRTYTLQASVSRSGSVTTIGSSGGPQDGAPSNAGVAAENSPSISGASRSAPEDSTPTKPDQDTGAPETSETGASRAAIARGVGKVACRNEAFTGQTDHYLDTF
eukprot:jgi/Undpi1/9317/HiC_scaffold_26.g11775.m1